MQHVAIPEFQDLETTVAQEISAAIAGHQSVGSALNKAQQYATDTARRVAIRNGRPGKAPAATTGWRPPPKRKLAAQMLWSQRGPLLPALLYALLLRQVPVILTLWYSFQSKNPLRPSTGGFVGLDNYTKILRDSLCRNAVWNTIVMTVSACH